ncbi:MAG: Ig-like domain-containing protein, partial [Thermoguttaceae bacterium]
WWRPDGSPLEQRPYKAMAGRVSGKNTVPREFAVRLTDLPQEPVGVRWQSEPSGSSAGCDELQNGPNNLRALAVTMPQDARTALIRIGVAAGPWHTLLEGDSGAATGSVGGGGVVFSDAYEKGGGVIISASHNIADQEVRLVAITKDGREHRSGDSIARSAANVIQLTATFPKIQRKDIQAFRLQTRPYEWAEFHKVSLRPIGESRRSGTPVPDTSGEPTETARHEASNLQTDTHRGQADSSSLPTEPDLQEMPPVVVRSEPISGQRNVTPGETEIRVTFSKPMTDRSWSWSTAWEDSTPKMLGEPKYLDDGRTCVVRAKLEPGRAYAFWLNSENFHNFQDRDGRPAVPYLLIFETKPQSSLKGSSP